VSAILSACGHYRHRLDREIDTTGPVVAIIGVNPSTADATVNDQTIRKDLGFGRLLGWRRIIKANKFDYRATDVRVLGKVSMPCHPDNDRYLREIMSEADLVIAAWGPLAKLPKQLRNRWRKVAALADECRKPLHCFGTANDGHPRHTLMLAYSTPLIEWGRP
jgi:hypothetical protein